MKLSIKAGGERKEEREREAENYTRSYLMGIMCPPTTLNATAECTIRNVEFPGEKRELGVLSIIVCY